MGKIKKIFLISYLFILISSCKENNPVKSPDFTSNLFPLKVGNWWRYQVVDSLRNTKDTLTLTIVSEKKLTGTIQYNCKLEINNIIDSLIIYSNEKFISISQSPPWYFVDTSYIQLPLFLKSSWGSNGLLGERDSVTEYILDDEILGKYYNTVNISERENYYNEYKRAHFKIASNIGIVNYYEYFNSMGFGILHNISLIDYYVK